MGQLNHDGCWIPARDLPQTERGVIIWTKKPWLANGTTTTTRHLDFGAWFSQKDGAWYHSDGHIAKGVTYWMEMPRNPIREGK